MTTPADLLDQTDALLLDFDGPLAALMPPPINARAADAAREAVSGVPLPPEIANTTDHLAVLRYVHKHHAEFTIAVESACTSAEVEAARRCAPSVHAENLFALIRRRGLPTAIVSNNSEQAVRTFLDRYGWASHVAAFSCRTPEDAARLKPSPFLIKRALDALDLAPSDALFIGDTLSDVQAATEAGVRILALAKHDQRGSELADAGAAAVASLTDPSSL